MEQMYTDYMTKQVDSLLKNGLPEHIAALTDLLQDPDFGARDFTDTLQASIAPVPQMEDAINSGYMFKLRFQLEPFIQTLLRDSMLLQFVIAESKKANDQSDKKEKEKLEIMQLLVQLVNDTYAQVGKYIVKRLAAVVQIEMDPPNENLRRQIVEMDKQECFIMVIRFNLLRNNMLYLTGPQQEPEPELP